MANPDTSENTESTGITRGTRTYTRTRTQVAAGGRGRLARSLIQARSWLARVWGVIKRAWTAVAAVVTQAGWLVVAWAIIGTAAGLLLGWDELLIGGVVGVVLLLVAVAFLIGSEPHKVEFSLEQDAVVAGEHVDGWVTVTNVAARIAWPSRIELPIGESVSELYVPVLRQGQSHTIRVALPTERRGVISVGPAVNARQDPLRLVRREFKWSDVYTLYVHPKTVAVPSSQQGFVRDLEGSATRVLTNEDISFHAVREYAPGDARRHMHWKSTAKTGTLMVRQFEQTRRSTMALILDRHRDSYATEQEFEDAVSAHASLVVRAIRDGREIAAFTSGHVPRYARASVRSLQRMRTVTPRAFLDDSSGIEGSVETMLLGPLSRMVADSARGVSVAIIVTGSLASLSTIAAATLSFPSEVAVAAIVADEGHEPEMFGFGRVQVVTIGLLEDLRQLMARGVARQ